MSRTNTIPKAFVIPLAVALVAACADNATTSPKFGARTHLAQGDNNTWTVNALADPGDGTCDDTDCTLREAIAAAASGGRIVFAGGLAGPIALTTYLRVDKSITIDGGSGVTLDAQSNERVMLVVSLGGPLTVTLDNLTMINGLSPTGGGLDVEGPVTAIVRNSTISDNVGSAEGGGIWVDHGASLTLVNTVVTRNTGSNFGGGIWSGSSITLVNSTVSGNQSNGEGGGIYNGGTLTLIASTVSGNEAHLGGGIHNELGNVSLRSTTLTMNHAKGIVGGGGLRNVEGVAQIVNSIVAGNTSANIGGISANNCSSVNGGTFTSLGYNVFVAGCFGSATTDVIIAAAQVFTEVIEPDLKDNGGPTMTHALITRGRAVDAGYCPGETEDQRGFTRPVDHPTMPNALDGCDIGAYEAQGPQVAVADLMVSQSVDKASAKQGEQVTYTVRVQNLGPQTAPNVVLTNILSSGVTFVEARVNKGTTTAPPKGETGTVTWNLNDLLDQANEAAEIKVTVLVRGKTTVTNTATVTGDVADPNTANNTASIKVSIASGGSGGGPPPKKG